MRKPCLNSQKRLIAQMTCDIVIMCSMWGEEYGYESNNKTD